MAESLTHDISEDALPVSPRSEEYVESEIGTRDVEDDTTEQNTGEDNEPVMEQLKGDSLLEGNRTETSSVLSDINLPHDNWAFNRLLVMISKRISEEELKFMKEMYKNEIGRKLLASINSALELFDNLQKRYFLTPVNLLQLECLLWDLDRKDLLQLVIDYAQQTKNVVYMHPATDQPVNGYTHVKFHISGKDFTNMTKYELCHIRAVVSSLLAMSPKFVLIDGVDQSNSVTVTILLTNGYAEVLKGLLQENTSEVQMLTYVGVDRITIHGQVYVVTDLHLTIEAESQEEIQNQVDIFSKYQDAKKVVSSLEIESINLKKRLEDFETEVMILKADSDVWRGCKPTPELAKCQADISNISVLEKQSSEQVDIGKALEHFSEALRQISEARYDKQLVLKLLQAHVTIISSRCYHELSTVIGLQNQQIQELLSDSLILKAISEVRRYMGDGTYDEPAEIKVLREISTKLRPNEREQLEKKYALTNDDKKLIREGSDQFLFIILNKEFQRGEGFVNINVFTRQCLLSIGRDDLLQLYTEQTRYEQERKAKRAESVDSMTGPVQNEVHTERNDREQTKDDMAADIKRVVKEIEEIKNSIKDKTEAFRFDKVANMKSEYLNLLYRTPTFHATK